MFSDLDASNLTGAGSFYEKQFEIILIKITACYKLMKKDKRMLPNDENAIRDVLVNEYINDEKIKSTLKLKYFVFAEVPETKTAGRTDIRIQDPNTFYNQEQYYIIECKRLDNQNLKGTTGLNAKYIENGIYRFTTKHYTSYFRVNGMIGFVVDEMDVSGNTNNINSLLMEVFTDANTTQILTKSNFIQDFTYHFHSTHTDTDGRPLKLYHLIFDFAENMQN